MTNIPFNGSIAIVKSTIVLFEILHPTSRTIPQLIRFRLVVVAVVLCDAFGRLPVQTGRSLNDETLI